MIIAALIVINKPDDSLGSTFPIRSSDYSLFFFFFVLFHLIYLMTISNTRNKHFSSEKSIFHVFTFFSFDFWSQMNCVVYLCYSIKKNFSVLINVFFMQIDWIWLFFWTQARKMPIKLCFLLKFSNLCFSFHLLSADYELLWALKIIIYHHHRLTQINFTERMLFSFCGLSKWF